MEAIAEGRRFLEESRQPDVRAFSPSSLGPENRASFALAYGLLALAEQFRRFNDILEASEAEAAATRRGT